MWGATPESPPMFERRFVDAFSRVPWWAVPVVWVPLIAGMSWYGVAPGGATAAGLGAGVAAELFVAGLFIWTLTEYWLHRTLFHWEPKTSWGPRMHFILHGVHHTWIDDRYRLVMPPAASLGLGAIFLGGWTLLLGWGLVLPFFAGKCTGYLCYDMIHYYVHHGRPTSRVMKRLRAHHMNHHHNKAGRKFGVSTTLWDHVFQTY